MNKQLELPTSPGHFILLFFNESKIGSIAKCASVISCALKGSGEKRASLNLFSNVLYSVELFDYEKWKVLKYLRGRRKFDLWDLEQILFDQE